MYTWTLFAVWFISYAIVAMIAALIMGALDEWHHRIQTRKEEAQYNANPHLKANRLPD